MVIERRLLTTERSVLSSLLVLILFIFPFNHAIVPIHHRAVGRRTHFVPPNNEPSLVSLRLRGGAVASKSTKKRKKRKKKKVKEEISEQLSQTDLGTAIRQHPEWLLQNNSTLSDSEKTQLEHVDKTITSVGRSMGVSDFEYIKKEEEEVPTSSILMYYFVQSHGGAHGVQCVCSLLSTLAGFAALFMTVLQVKASPASVSLDIIRPLVQTSLQWATLKHVTGVISACLTASKVAVRAVGLDQTKRFWMQPLANDSISQYVFYTACVGLWWRTLDNSVLLSRRLRLWTILLVIGPVMLREIVSTGLVLQDVVRILLLPSSTGRHWSMTILQSAESTVNVVMSLLVTPQKWRKADRGEQLQVVAQIVNRVSLLLQVGLALCMIVDVGVNAISSKPHIAWLRGMVVKLMCTKLYLDFLYHKRNKVAKLVSAVRGGAAELPLYCLEVLSHPLTSMGLVDESSTKTKQPHEGVQRKKTAHERDTGNPVWKDYLREIMDFR